MAKFSEGDQVLVNGRLAVVKRQTSNGNHLGYFSPPTPKPGVAVGQWASKWLSLEWDTEITANPNPDTYIDYDAWVEAFHRVYSNS